MRVGLFALGILVAVASAAAPAYAARDGVDDVVDDPWSAGQVHITHTARLIIDVEDPWGGAIVAHPPSARLSVDTIDPFARAHANANANTPALPPAYHPRAAGAASAGTRASDDAVRAAIKAAIDAGELDRARALIDLLQKR